MDIKTNNEMRIGLTGKGKLLLLEYEVHSLKKHVVLLGVAVSILGIAFIVHSFR